LKQSTTLNSGWNARSRLRRAVTLMSDAELAASAAGVAYLV